MMTNCPNCQGRKAGDDNNLSVVFPEIAKEWDYSKNKTKPNEYTFGSHFMAWWKCKKNHKSFKSIIKERTRKKYPRVCQMCKKN